ncbi:MAG: WecB/TagA/CpsF family glycosyltransferase [Victivallales bacterium]|nr:WecB/TagA/CpsF family glycosyltransferase [Victivallales bacterium]
MRFLVSCIPFDNGKSGISVYTQEVVRELLRQGHELTLFLEPGEDGEAWRALGATVKFAPRWTGRALFSMLWHLLVLPFWIWWRRREFDGLVICAANRRVCAFYPIPTTATVHDLANFHIANKYSRLRMFYLAHVMPFFAKRAHRLVAVSGATKADMCRFWHCREEDVTVLYNGCAMPESQGEAAHGGALLYISRIEHPGKNHVRLIEAYSRLEREVAQAHPLLLAGADWRDAETVHKVAAQSPNAECIRFTGFVEDLGSLWREAGFYVFPSLFEGFGLSLIEAMRQGIPCACSNNGALGELAGEAAVTFDPENVDEMAAALKKLLGESASERSARIARGYGQAGKFSWEAHAKGIVQLLQGCHQADGRVRMFGIPVAKLTENEALERIVAMAKTPTAGRSRQVATLNVNFISTAVAGWPFKGNPELWGYLRNADLVTADGMPLVLLSRLMFNPLPERVAGANLVPALFRRFAEEGLSIYVLGGDKEVLDKALDILPKAKVVGTDLSWVQLDKEQPEILERINAAKPDLLFLALGHPKQELWIGRNLAKLNVPVAIGIGGSFNFIAGAVKRAPQWIQTCGLEWVYRICQEPGRLWKRYAVDLVRFAWFSVKQLCGGYR